MTLPTFAELAGDTEPRVIEASRLFRAKPDWRGTGDDGARAALIGATDAAAREHALRWLEREVAMAIETAEMLQGARADASDTQAWDADAWGMLEGGALAELQQVLVRSTMPRDPAWPLVAAAVLDVFDPSIRGDATRLLRDMWWRHMMHEHIEARRKPGQFLASVGLVAADVARIVEEGEETRIAADPDMRPRYPAPVVAALVPDAPAAFVSFEPGAVNTLDGAPFAPPAPDLDAEIRALLGDDEPEAPAAQEVATAEEPARRPPGRPPGSRNAQRPAGRLPDVQGPGAGRLPGAKFEPPTGEELQEAFRCISDTDMGENTATLLPMLAISKSTWNNWRGGRTQPRITPEQARVMAAECARCIALFEQAEAIFRRVTR